MTRVIGHKVTLKNGKSLPISQVFTCDKIPWAPTLEEVSGLEDEWCMVTGAVFTPFLSAPRHRLFSRGEPDPRACRGTCECKSELGTFISRVKGIWEMFFWPIFICFLLSCWLSFVDLVYTFWIIFTVLDGKYLLSTFPNTNKCRFNVN